MSSDPFSLLDSAVLVHLGECIVYLDQTGRLKEIRVLPVDKSEINYLQKNQGAVKQKVKTGRQFEVLTSALPELIRKCEFVIAGMRYECADQFEIDDTWSMITLAPKQKFTGGNNGSFFRDEN